MNFIFPFPKIVGPGLSQNIHAKCFPSAYYLMPITVLARMQFAATRS